MIVAVSTGPVTSTWLHVNATLAGLVTSVTQRSSAVTRTPVRTDRKYNLGYILI